MSLNPKLDDMLTREEAAAWLQLTIADLAKKSAGPKPVIPVFRLGHKSARYHPRTIITKLAQDSGRSFEQIAASFGMIEKEKC
jgi:hypothetical protein